MPRFIIIISVLLVFSCGKKEAVLPIPSDMLIEILIDIHTAESIIESETPSVRDSMIGVYYNQIFEKYRINRSLFDTTMALLGYHPQQMEKIYEKVTAEMNKRQQ